jgi:pimeloyl-ACP methyl ester carboxylesterase
MGGVIAQSFYFAHPSRVARLVLAHTFPSFRALGERVVAGFTATRLQPVLEGASPADLASSAANALLAPSAPSEARQRLMTSLSALRRDSYVKTIRGLLAQKPGRELETIAVPTLIIAGEMDRLVPLSMAQHMAGRIPDSRLTVIQDVGHLSNLERPHEFNELAAAFFRTR